MTLPVGGFFHPCTVELRSGCVTCVGQWKVDRVDTCLPAHGLPSLFSICHIDWQCSRERLPWVPGRGGEAQLHPVHSGHGCEQALFLSCVVSHWFSDSCYSSVLWPLPTGELAWDRSFLFWYKHLGYFCVILTAPHKFWDIVFIAQL